MSMKDPDTDRLLKIHLMKCLERCYILSLHHLIQGKHRKDFMAKEGVKPVSVPQAELAATTIL